MITWREIHNRSAMKPLEYVVMPSESVQGKSLDDMKRMSLRSVRPENENGHDDRSGIDGILCSSRTGAKRTTGDRKAQGAGHGNLAEQHRKLIPKDEQISSVLSGIRFTIHVEGSEATREEGRGASR